MAVQILIVGSIFMDELRRKDKILREAAKNLSADPENLPNIIRKFQKEIEEMEK